MSKGRKILGFVLILLGGMAIAASLWDKPVDLGFYELDVYQLGFLKGSGALGIINISVILAGILLIIIGSIVGIVRSTAEVKEENTIKHNLSAQKEISSKLEERINDEKMRYDKLRKQIQVKRKIDIQKKKAMNSSLKKGTAMFEDGKFEEAIIQWEDALAVENKNFILSIRNAKAKVDMIKSAFTDGGEKRCPYCQAELMGFEEQCPQCFENLLAPEEIIKRSLQAGLEKYIEEEYSEAITAWMKVLAIDPGHDMAAKYIQGAEEKLDAGSSAPIPAEPEEERDILEEMAGTTTGPVDVTEEAEMDLNGEAPMPEISAEVPEVGVAMDEGDQPAEIAEGDLQEMDLGDLDLDETDDMDSIEDMLSEIGVTGGKMKPEEVGGVAGGDDDSEIPELKAAAAGSSEMYECEVCGAMMATDQLTCPKCGTEYDE